MGCVDQTAGSIFCRDIWQIITIFLMYNDANRTYEFGGDL